MNEKIYCTHPELDKSSPYNFLVSYIKLGSPETYFEDGRLQCHSRRRRSLDDMVSMVSTEFPGWDYATLADMILEGIEKEELNTLLYCPNISRFVMAKENYAPYLVNTEYLTNKNRIAEVSGNEFYKDVCLKAKKWMDNNKIVSSEFTNTLVELEWISQEEKIVEPEMV